MSHSCFHYTWTDGQTSYPCYIPTYSVFLYIFQCISYYLIILPFPLLILFFMYQFPIHSPCVNASNSSYSLFFHEASQVNSIYRLRACTTCTVSLGKIPAFQKPYRTIWPKDPNCTCFVFSSSVYIKHFCKLLISRATVQTNLPMVTKVL